MNYISNLINNLISNYLKLLQKNIISNMLICGKTNTVTCKQRKAHTHLASVSCEVSLLYYLKETQVFTHNVCIHANNTLPSDMYSQNDRESLGSEKKYRL